MIPSISNVSTVTLSADKEDAIRTAAEKLEATFVAEMLKSAGLGQSPELFGGGQGEDQFASFLVDEHAKALVAAGGIGLAESIFDSLVQRMTNDG